MAGTEGLNDDLAGSHSGLRAEILAAEGDLPPEAPAAPDPSRSDVRRAWQAIAAREATANAWRAPLGAVPAGNPPCGKAPAGQLKRNPTNP